MKKSLIPILSLLAIISLDSCKKDSDNQPAEQDTTRVAKITYTHSTDPDNVTINFEYDKSGRIISLKDSAHPDYVITISYVGDEAIYQEPPAKPGDFNYSARYKLNANRQPVQRIIAENLDGMTANYPRFQIHADTCKYEYDAAGLLVKANGTRYDSSWSNANQSISFSSTRRTYAMNYTNKDGKLMSFVRNATEESSYTGGGSISDIKVIREENYTFEYTKNYANKVDSINAWLFVELGSLYSSDYPMIKYASIPDVMNRSEKYTNVTTGDVRKYTDQPLFRTVEYLPAGYVSSVTFSSGQYWDRTGFTYNNQ